MTANENERPPKEELHNFEESEETNDGGKSFEESSLEDEEVTANGGNSYLHQ